MNKKNLLIALAILSLCLLGGFTLWKKYASRTEVALVNFPAYQASGIILSNQDKEIHYTKLRSEDIEHFDDYDYLLVFGMGLHWTKQEQSQVKELMTEGLPLQVIYATTPENELCSIDSLKAQSVLQYFSSGNKKNYQSLARYIRQHIDEKKLFIQEADSLAPSPYDVYYHIDEEIAIDNKEDFDKYLKAKDYYYENAPRVLISGGLNNPFSGNKENLDSLIASLSKAGMNVYPIASMMKKMNFVEEVKPDLVLYMPHGRFVMGGGDVFVDYLKEHNIPAISLLTILAEKEKWEADPMGLVGGFMSQSVVMPELDGAIYPYVFAAEEVNEEGNHLVKAIPNRLARLTELCKRLLSLKTKANAEKKLTLYYYKASGREGISAGGLEAIPSLYNFLHYLKGIGYQLEGLPNSLESFRDLVMAQNKAFDYSRSNIPKDEVEQACTLISKDVVNRLITENISPYLRKELTEHYGEACGSVMNYIGANGEEGLVLPRLVFGNIALVIQPSPAISGENSFAVSHGKVKAPLPYPYIMAYLWAKDIFKTDAIMHFGTHGTIEFTPSKQLALSDRDWSDQLIAPLPHYYYYQTANVGEGLIAKRRTYASLNTYITPPFDGTNTQSLFTDLHKRIDEYYKSEGEERRRASLLVKAQAIKMGLSRDLELDSVSNKPYTEEEIERIDNFAEEVAGEQINTKLYTMGQAYTQEECYRTVQAITAEALANARFKLDVYKHKVQKDFSKNKRRFKQVYLTPAKTLINKVLRGQAISPQILASYCSISPAELKAIKEFEAKGEEKASAHRSKMMEMMMKKSKEGKKPSADMMMKMMKAHQRMAQKKKNASKPKYAKEYINLLTNIEQIIKSVPSYQKAIMESPEKELKAIANALSGGYTAPTSGGDPIANPLVLPTGRNMYGINAEATPSRRAWEKAVLLVNEMLADYEKKHKAYPKKVSYTFWSSAFVESEGTTLAQAMYLLGVEPIRNMFGRVVDLRLIPEEELGRPRIDILVQTSGQFRDLAASRLFLLQRAIKMASEAPKEKHANFVADGSVNLEKQLVLAGLSPRKARELAHKRIFGGIGGMYGTGIQGMVTSGDKWENNKEIADVYIHNMGASYGSREDWEQYAENLFRSALNDTDIVIQPRQSNTWGALSLDHVYEFMGGLNLSVRSVTGKDPEAYFADYRKRSHFRIQGLKEAVGVESRATLLNKHYVEEVLKGDASSLGQITEFVTNSYGWETMKPTLLEDSYWNEVYKVYIKDSFQLGVQQRFAEVYPSAMTEITAVMLETSRKGLWQASAEQLRTLADLHSDLAHKFGLEGTDFARNNKKLQDYIEQKVSKDLLRQYQTSIKKQEEIQVKSGVVMTKEDVSNENKAQEHKPFAQKIIFFALGGLLLIIIFLVWRKRKQ